MTYRDLHLRRAQRSDPTALYILDAAGHIIGEAYKTKQDPDHGWAVMLDEGISGSRYGLDGRRRTFRDLDAVEEWAGDFAIKRCMLAAQDMSDVDLQRLRGYIADLVTARVSMAITEPAR
tara:strand:+ start:151 stop:510 length:360 start_codon:yes stop_codon:yes gene_type:complete